MLLNLFFENMNSKLELLLIGGFIFAIYWFILRKYNTLGLRLFTLCFLLFVACCVWVYKSESSLKKAMEKGEIITATVLAKSKVGKNDNEVEVSFIKPNKAIVSAKTSEYISALEWESFETGKPVEIMYVAATSEVFVKQSLVRFTADKIYLYYFAGFWLVLGVVCLILLRKIRVGVDENTGAEWLVKEDGTTFFDERKSATTRTVKQLNIISKLAQAFGK